MTKCVFSVGFPSGHKLHGRALLVRRAAALFRGNTFRCPRLVEKSPCCFLCVCSPLLVKGTFKCGRGKTQVLHNNKGMFGLLRRPKPKLKKLKQPPHPPAPPTMGEPLHFVRVLPTSLVIGPKKSQPPPSISQPLLYVLRWVCALCLERVCFIFCGGCVRCAQSVCST